MKRTHPFDIVACTLIVLLVAAVCLPVMGVGARSYNEARCQSNLRRLAEALAAYAADNGCYPTNRRYVAGTTTPLSTPYHTVLLSPPEYDSNGDPVRGVKGLSWVEGLYPYLIKTAKSRGQDWMSFLRCPSACATTYPAGSTARVTYVMNFNLLDANQGAIRRPESLYAIRETYLQVNSVCRPVTLSTGNPSIVPAYPFLRTADPYFETVSQMADWLHGQGSFILFADGHVHHFTTDYFPYDQSFYTTANCWDAETGQWWNYGPGSGVGPPLLKSIAITP